MTVQHGMTPRQLDMLARHVATPVEHFGHIDWVLPAWWHLAYAAAVCGGRLENEDNQ